MENQALEDVSPMRNGDFPASHVSFRGVGVNIWRRLPSCQICFHSLGGTQLISQDPPSTMQTKIHLQRLATWTNEYVQYVGKYMFI